MKIHLLFSILLIVLSCQPKDNRQASNLRNDTTEGNYTPLKPVGVTSVKSVTLYNDVIRAVFIDNSALGEHHREGYNGIAELIHEEQDSNVFVPYYAGFNLEHIFDGDSLQELFEPRNHPMELFPVSGNEVILYQSPTPLSSVESRTMFKLSDPTYIDINFRFIIHDTSFFKHGYAGLFWASYIQVPDDKKMYFLGNRKGEDPVHWIGAYSEKHGVKSTHLNSLSDTSVYFAENFNATLASHFSEYIFDKPFFYGRFHNMVLIYMFDRMEGIRFSQSPTGGGQGSPAWDFQFIRNDWKTMKEYSFRARIVYKPFIDRDDVIREYEIWNQSH